MDEKGGVVWKRNGRLAYDMNGRISVLWSDIDLMSLVLASDAALDDARAGKIILLISPQDGDAYAHAFLAKLDNETTDRLRFVTASRYVFVSPDDIGGVIYDEHNYYVAKLPSSEKWYDPKNVPTSLDALPPSNGIYNEDSHQWFTNHMKLLEPMRQSFLKQVNEIKVDTTSNLRLRLTPIALDAGLRLNKPSGRQLYQLLYPPNIQNHLKPADKTFASVFAPFMEFFDHHLHVIPTAFDGQDIVLWKNQLHPRSNTGRQSNLLGDDLTVITALDGHIEMIDSIEGKVYFKTPYQTIQFTFEEFFGPVNESMVGYRLLLPPSAVTVVPQTVPVHVAKLVVERLVMLSRRDWPSKLPEEVFDILIENAISAPFRVAKMMNTATKKITDTVKYIYLDEIAEFQKAKAAELKLELESPVTGAWAAYCSNDLEYLTREPMALIRNGEDIVSILPPESKLSVGGFCYRRANLITMMIENVVYDWPRPADRTQDIVYRRVDPGFWVTDESLKLVESPNPKYSLFKLVPVGNVQVGTQSLVISAMHGTPTTIYHLDPLKTKTQVLEDIKSIKPPQSSSASSSSSSSSVATTITRVPSGLSGLTGLSAQRKQELMEMMERNRRSALQALALQQQQQPPMPMQQQPSMEQFANRLAMALDDAKRSINPPPQQTDTMTDVKTPLPVGTTSAVPSLTMQLRPRRPPAAAADATPTPVFHMQLRSRNNNGATAMDVDRSGGGHRASIRFFRPKIR
jgi:hypothetical protein